MQPEDVASDALLKLEILGAKDEPGLSDEDPEGWHVQIFRLIDSNSVKGFPKDPHVATAKVMRFDHFVLVLMT
ncbi:hypothetical protein L2E82_05104 [Cichorium intybus]|uniref:Uncharacterized protein n=1 Tax=Cichorium intybus TaxID=13427 RepID=A0ACB9H6J1_CICIN|nr:hypothetical protein L2E82_05104 [Cichorium intybus]